MFNRDGSLIVTKGECPHCHKDIGKELASEDIPKSRYIILTLTHCPECGKKLKDFDKITSISAVATWKSRAYKK